MAAARSSDERATRMTLAPSEAATCEVASPMPFDAPVTTMLWFVRFHRLPLLAAAADMFVVVWRGCETIMCEIFSELGLGW